MTREPFSTTTSRPLDDSAVQPGSTVFDADGAELGRIIAVDADGITIKRKGFLGGRITVPRRLIGEAEEGHVELTVPGRDAPRR